MVETTDFGAFAARILRALRKRASDDADALPILATIEREATQALNEAIYRCHLNGWSTSEIAARLGVSKQAVHQRVQRQARLDEKRRQGDVDD